MRIFLQKAIEVVNSDLNVNYKKGFIVTDIRMTRCLFA